MTTGSAATHPTLSKAAASAVLAPAKTDQEKQVVDYSCASSTTHMKDWKQFMRKVLSGNERKFPPELAPKLESDRNQLFVDWLSNDKSFAAVKLYHARKNVSSKEMAHKFGFKMRHELMSMYNNNADAVTKLINQKVREGKYKPNPEMPDDADFTLYWVRLDQTFEQKEGIIEEAGLKAEAEVDKEGCQALCKAGGMFASGRGLAVPGLSDAISGTFMIEAGGGDSSKVNSKSKNKLKNKDPNREGSNEEPQPFVAQAPRDRATTVMASIMKQAKEARGYSVSLAAHQFSSDLVRQLKGHAEAMEKLYTQVQQLVMAGSNNEQVYRSLFESVERRTTWYEQRQRLAHSMEQSVKPKAAAKAKAGTKAKTQAPKT